MRKYRIYYECPNPDHKMRAGQPPKIFGKIISLVIEAPTEAAALGEVEGRTLHCTKCGQDFKASDKTRFRIIRVKEEGLGTYRVVLKCPDCPEEKDGEQRYNIFYIDIQARGIMDATKQLIGKRVACGRGKHEFIVSEKDVLEPLGEVGSLKIKASQSFGPRIPEAEREVEMPLYLRGGDILKPDGSAWMGARPKNIRPLGPFLTHSYVSEALPPIKKWAAQLDRPVEILMGSKLLGLEGMDLQHFVHTKPIKTDSFLVYGDSESEARTEAQQRIPPGSKIVNMVYAGTHPLQSIFTTYLFRRGLYSMNKPEEWDKIIETKLNLEGVEVEEIYVPPPRELVGYVQFASNYVSRFLNHARQIARGAHKTGMRREPSRAEYASVYEKHAEGPLIESIDYFVHHQPGVSIIELSLLLDLNYFRVYKAVHSMTGWGMRQGQFERKRLFREAKRAFLEAGLGRDLDEDFKKILKGWRPLDEPWFETKNKFILGGRNFTESATIWPTQPLTLKQLEEDWVNAIEIGAWLPPPAEWKMIKGQLEQEENEKRIKREQALARSKLEFYTK